MFLSRSFHPCCYAYEHNYVIDNLFRFHPSLYKTVPSTAVKCAHEQIYNLYLILVECSSLISVLKVNLSDCQNKTSIRLNGEKRREKYIHSEMLGQLINDDPSS